jgi:hypothetical protein
MKITESVSYRQSAKPRIPWGEQGRGTNRSTVEGKMEGKGEQGVRRDGVQMECARGQTDARNADVAVYMQQPLRLACRGIIHCMARLGKLAQMQGSRDKHEVRIWPEVGRQEQEWDHGGKT